MKVLEYCFAVLTALVLMPCGILPSAIGLEPEVIVKDIQNSTTKAKVKVTPAPKPPSCPWSCEITSAASSCGRPYIKVKKIAGGKVAGKRTWPWMGALWSEGKLICGAALVCRSWVLTAAHCFLNQEQTELNFTKPITLYLGRIYKLGQHRTVRSFNVTKNMVITHPAYHIKDRVNDIALIRLPGPVKITKKIRPICLPEFGKSGPKPGTICRVAGWGDTRGFGPSNKRLKELVVPIVSSNICKFSYRFTDAEKILCAGGKKEQDACGGDSGGPLICESTTSKGQWQAHGIVSFGHKTCGTENFPSTFTQISYYLFWIYTTMDNECQKWRKTHGYL